MQIVFLKWCKRTLIIFGIYCFLHVSVSIIADQQVIDRTDRSVKGYDGPLIMKDFGQLDKKNVLSGIQLLNSKPINSRDRDPELFVPENVTYKVPKLPDRFLQKVREKALQIQSFSDDFLLFTLINQAYVNLTLNWLCNVAIFGSNSSLHRKTLIVSLDSQVCTTIASKWSSVSCLHFQLTDDYNEPLDWGRQRYINLLTVRAQLMQTLVQLDIPFILFETDAIWFRDPMEFFQNQTLIDDADIVVPTKSYVQKGLTYSFDPMIVYPTNGSKYLMREMSSRLIADPKLYDQDILDELCRTQFNGLVCRMFDWSQVADGKWFRLSDSERRNLRPYIVNNNFYVGVKNKISRQALHGLWFITPKVHCSIAKVRSTISKYSR